MSKRWLRRQQEKRVIEESGLIWVPFTPAERMRAYRARLKARRENAENTCKPNMNNTAAAADFLMDVDVKKYLEEVQIMSKYMRNKYMMNWRKRQREEKSNKEEFKKAPVTPAERAKAYRARLKADWENAHTAGSSNTAVEAGVTYITLFEGRYSRTCAIKGCKSVHAKGNGTHFYSFPRNPKYRNQWIQFVNREDFDPGKNNYICSKHFETNCIKVTPKGRTYLRKDAVPTLLGFKNTSIGSTAEDVATTVELYSFENTLQNEQNDPLDTTIIRNVSSIKEEPLKDVTETHMVESTIRNNKEQVTQTTMAINTQESLLSTQNSLGIVIKEEPIEKYVQPPIKVEGLENYSETGFEIESSDVLIKRELLENDSETYIENELKQS